MRITKQHADDALIGVWSAADQTHKKRSSDSGNGAEDTAGDAGGQKKIAKRGEELKDEMDSLIDEIDEVLEENAEEFVKNYVQRGGE